MAKSVGMTGAHPHQHADERDDASVEEVQRVRYGGFNLGAGLFGWLVAVGVGVVLTALLSVLGGTAIFGATDIGTPDIASGAATTIGTVGAVLIVIVLAVAYYAGGYVAGRMSRFDGGRQGFGVWVIGLVLAVLAAILTAIFGSSYNVLQQINFPNVPLDVNNLTTAGVITLLVALVVTLAAAVLGGKVGQRYHAKIDAVAAR